MPGPGQGHAVVVPVRHLDAGDGLRGPAFAQRHVAWTTLTETVSTSTSYTATGLTNNVNYYFRVAAVGANGPGEFSFSRVGQADGAADCPAHPDGHGRPAEPGREVGRLPVTGAPFSLLPCPVLDEPHRLDRALHATATTLPHHRPGRRREVLRPCDRREPGGQRSRVGDGERDPDGGGPPFSSARRQAVLDPDRRRRVRLGRAGLQRWSHRDLGERQVREHERRGDPHRHGDGLVPPLRARRELTKFKTYRCTATLGNRLGAGPSRTGAAFVVPVLPAAPTAVRAVVSGGG